MGKLRTSKKRKGSSKNTRREKKVLKIKEGMGVKTIDPVKELLDEKLISGAIWECLKDGDYEGVIEMVEAHLDAVNITKLAKKGNLPKTTMYHVFRSKNPTLKTLSKIIKAACGGKKKKKPS